MFLIRQPHLATPKVITVNTETVSGVIDVRRVVQQLKKGGFDALRQGARRW